MLDLQHPVEDVARDLIGWTFVHVKAGRLTSGRIVEAEAYGGVGEDDCSHAHRRRTPRNAVMFGPTGRLYVYFTYGMHHCANIVAHPPGVAGAVLLRALEPLEGIELMQRRRRTSDVRNLCSGPARLVEAMGLARRDNGRRFGTSSLYLRDDGVRPAVAASARIGVRGIHDDRRWRFCAVDSPWLSRRP